MTILALESDLQADLSQVMEYLPETPVDCKDSAEFQRAASLVPEALKQSLSRLAAVVSQILQDNSYVQIRGFPNTDDARSIMVLGHALGSVFDDLSHQTAIVCEASPALKATLQGNQTEALFLHTDFAMLDKPPEGTLIQCCSPDPLGTSFGDNGVAVGRHIYSRFFGTSRIKLVLETPMPFAGTKPDGSTILAMHPIMERGSDGNILLRFHPSRIHHGFRIRATPPLQQELDAMAAFHEMALAVRINFPQLVGDVLVVNNRLALHDRGLCSLSLSRQAIRARVSRILFIQKFNDQADI
jgi:hypothetical protein